MGGAPFLASTWKENSQPTVGSIFALSVNEAQRVLRMANVTYDSKDKLLELQNAVLQHYYSVTPRFTQQGEPIDSQSTSPTAGVEVLVQQGVQAITDAASKAVSTALEQFTQATERQRQADKDASYARALQRQEELVSTVKTTVEGTWQTVQHKQADTAQRQLRTCNLLLRNVPQAESESKAKLDEEVEKVLQQLGTQSKPVQVRRLNRAKVAQADVSTSTVKSQRPAPVLLTFASAEDRLAVLKSRKRLAGTPYGLDEDLTPLQQKERQALWPKFQEAKAQGKRVTWRGAQLLVEGKPVPIPASA